MADDSRHDGAPLEVLLVFPPVVEAEEPIAAEASKAAQGIEANLEAEFEPKLEPEPLPLRVRPFDSTRYHLHTHILPPEQIRHFNDFAYGVPEDLLLREPASHLSSIAIEGESHAFRGYGATTARDLYDELLAGVCDIMDETSFSFFCFGQTRVIASRPLLGALVEQWCDTTNSFHFSTTGEKPMTFYDFSMLTGLGVGGDLIPFDTNMGE
ncbi:protein MAIN-LIKE 2-like [Camellia sinensis]|uniref:protein MAIN-LIKE 2-like n=1 Tax=Camellia sinensis TaxID=4442 RepID=UPI001036DA5C|nr:protein MAIN-LIKE 2-like [Camellia sinensis]